MSGKTNELKLINRCIRLEKALRKYKKVQDMKAGDVVKLRSSFRSMTVRLVVDTEGMAMHLGQAQGSVLCDWHDDHGTPQQHFYLPEMLDHG